MMATESKIILAGGNGYIGGTTAFALKEAGFNPIILDNFSTSRKGALSEFDIYETDLRDIHSTREIFRKLNPVSGIIHFAAKALVPESFQKPRDYFENNLMSTLNLAELAKEFQVPAFIHSSSCAVYGLPFKTPIPEDSALHGNSPYGDTKILAESLLNSYSKLRSISLCHLRYFNPAGADLLHSWGELHEPETHLIPNLVRTALNEEVFPIFGNQYPTPDGTCIRDFIHVMDLAEAHVLTLQRLLQGNALPRSINIGSGKGTSVGEVVKIAEQVLKKPISVEIKAPRAGDPPELVSETSLMRQHLQWEPQRSVAQMILDDWSWRQIQVK